MERNEYSVIETAAAVAQSCKGTCDESTPEHITMLCDWLAWRTSLGWRAEHGDVAFDSAVRDMAIAAVRIGREWCRALRALEAGR